MKFYLRNNKWIRRIHAWIGFILIPLILIYAFSGIYLQHRDILKINGASTLRTKEETVLQSPLKSIKEFKYFINNKYPDYLSRGEFKDIKPVLLETLDEPLIIPATWQFSSTDIKHRISVQYTPKTLVIKSEIRTNNFIETLKELHKGKGMGVSWILFSDLASIGLIILSISSLFMWTRLHGKANLGISLITIGTILTIFIGLIS